MVGAAGVGLVGCGTAGGAHAITVGRHPDARLVACVDADPARARELAAEHGGRAVATLGELVACDPRIIVVATGPAEQPALVHELIDLEFRGGILCEKPLSLSLAEGRELAVRAADAGVTLAVNHQRRFGEPFVRALALLREGRVGDLVRMEGFGPKGTLLDWGPHWVDYARLVVGDDPITWVDGLADFQEPQAHAGLSLEGHAMITWRHEGGVRGVLETSGQPLGQPLFRLWGTGGVIEIGCTEPDGEGGWRRGTRLRVLAASAGNGDDPAAGIESPLAPTQWERSLGELITAVREKRAPLHDADRALAALEVCLAGYRAALGGGRQRLPLDPAYSLRGLTAVRES
ncbi:Gfo/Idh/MocA family protein [Actinomadura viridis]|uniref:Gfo/Idh/MocA family protein n=1 Tax=Actinomadura viridis TaxID=58110 RepID=UPI00367B7563